MPNKQLHTARAALRWSTLALGTMSIALVTAAVTEGFSNVDAWLIRRKVEPKWEVLEAAEVASGTTINADTHTVFHLPQTFDTIVRETLFGLKGKRVRYWGYCFPANYDPATVDMRRGFPGLLFLSEREREVRETEFQKKKRDFSPFNLPTSEEVSDIGKRSSDPIRHQLDVFKPGTLCYIMSEEALSIGLDPDGDRLNDKMEAELKTDPAVPDSDGDGIIDGVEYQYGTVPSIRDTDNDGVIDGLEDENWNGRVNPGETDPRIIDTDRDGLCDGFCRVKVQNQWIFMGEDKNLNGEVDAGETDSTLVDTDGDGYSDEVEYMSCLAAGNTECPEGDLQESSNSSIMQ